jgi:bifunctional DNA-binding transcriptional regulator/antitoxin component of YhaV-PrlF toxin-antitoxin module
MKEKETEEFVARVVRNNRITIPKNTVKLLKIKMGNLVRIRIRKEN